MNCRTHEHRHFERTLRSTDTIPGPRLAEGRFSTPKLLAPLLVSFLKRDTRARTSDVGRSPRLRARDSNENSILLGERVSSVSPPWASSEMTRRRARVRRVVLLWLSLCVCVERDGTCARRENEREEGAAAAVLCSFLRAAGGRMIEKVLRAPGIPTALRRRRRKNKRESPRVVSLSFGLPFRRLRDIYKRDACKSAARRHHLS